MQLEMTFSAAQRIEKRAQKLSSWDLLRGGAWDTEAGTPVNPPLAENLSATFACVQLISQTVSMLPLVLYLFGKDGSRYEERAHPVARLFSGDVSDFQTGPEFFEGLMANVLLHGNAYAEIHRDSSGAVLWLGLLHPSMVTVERLPKTNRVRYAVTDLNGISKRLLPEEMLHIRDRSDDGIVGKSRLQRARESFGIALQTERYAANVYRNGAALSGFVSHPETLGPEAAKTLRDSLNKVYGGTAKAGSIGVLEEAMTWQAAGVSPLDAQALESRRFSVESIARLFGIPPQLIGDTSKSAFANQVEASRHFARFTIAPWLRKLETAFASALLSESDRQRYELEFDLDDLLRGDFLQRMQGYRIAREIGVYNANELRKFEKQNPRTDDGGEKYFEPMNMNPEQTEEKKDKTDDRGNEN